MFNLLTLRKNVGSNITVWTFSDMRDLDVFETKANCLEDAMSNLYERLSMNDSEELMIVVRNFQVPDHQMRAWYRRGVILV